MFGNILTVSILYASIIIVNICNGGKMMLSIFHVAKYILEFVGGMTAMKLQKLAYYCQAWSLAWDEVPLFEEDFQAWANGPVCPELFEKHKGKFFLEENFLNEVSDGDFSAEQIKTMDEVLKYYGNKEPQWLSELTHKEIPWREARKGYTDGENCKVVITKDSMQQYYGGLQ